MKRAMKGRIIKGVMALVMGIYVFSGSAIAEVGVSDTEILIGSHLDLSGPVAVVGLPWKRGMEMRAREINEAGGIYGRKIRLVIEDNGYDTKKAIMVTNKVIDRDKVFCFMANMGSPTAGATKPIISGKKIPQLFPATSASLFFEPFDRYSFANLLPYYDQGRILVKRVIDNKKFKKFGSLYQDDEMGTIINKGYVDQLAAYNINLVAAETYKRGATDFSSQISKLRQAGAEVVLLGTIVRETVGALKEAKQIGWNVPMGGPSGSASKHVVELCKQAGFSADGYLAVCWLNELYADAPSPTVREFWQRYEKEFGKGTAPDTSVAAGHFGLSMFAEAARRAGRDLTREKLVDAFETFNRWSDGTFKAGPWTYTSTTRQGAYDGFVVQVQNDRWVGLTDAIGYKN